MSQSVEHDHPMALDFLRRDCSIMNDFFDKKKLNVLGIQEVFNFTTDLSIAEDDEETVLQGLLEAQNNKSPEELLKGKSDDAVFKEIYIPRTLQELSLDEVLKMRKSNSEEVYASLTGLKTQDDKEEVEEAEEDGTECLEEIKEESKQEGPEESDSDSSGSGSDEPAKQVKISDVSAYSD